MSEPHRFSSYRLVIFDADDTLRKTIVPGQPCPYRAGEWELMPGVREMLLAIPWETPEGPHLGLASNQDHVAYGHLSLAEARSLLRELALAATGVIPEDAAIQLCPHPLTSTCECRKPRPGMLLRIMAHFGVARDATLFVGNAVVDRDAAAAAGVAYCWSDLLFGREEEAVQQ